VSVRAVVLVPAFWVVCSVIALGGCSASHTTPPTTTTSTSAPVSTAPSLVPIVNDPTLRQQVALNVCKAVSGGWEASGLVRNSGTKEQTYDITVYFTDSVATVIGSAQTSATVAAGKSADWSAQARFSAPPVVKCVLVGVH